MTDVATHAIDVAARAADVAACLFHMISYVTDVAIFTTDVATRGQKCPNFCDAVAPATAVVSPWHILRTHHGRHQIASAIHPVFRHVYGRVYKQASHHDPCAVVRAAGLPAAAVGRACSAALRRLATCRRHPSSGTASERLRWIGQELTSQ